MFRYRCEVTCWRADIGPVPRKFYEGDIFEVAEKIKSPKFTLIAETAEKPPAGPGESQDKQLAGLQDRILNPEKKKG